MLNLLKIISIRKYLDKETAAQLIVSLCLSHLGYANGLLIGLPDCSIKHIQKVQNMAAKVVLNLMKHDSSTDIIKALHWLPIRQQIEYKFINLTQQCMHGQAPNHLKKLLEIHKPHWAGLRSSLTAHKWDLKVKFTRKRTFADRSFALLPPNYGTNYQHHKKKLHQMILLRNNLKLISSAKHITNIK